MRDSVARDNEWSTAALHDVVWPAIAGHFPGCSLEDGHVLNGSLDMHAGCDALITGNGRVRGLAQRTQAGPSYDTFTIRFERITGVPTEWVKRRNEIAEDELHAHITVHSYVDGDPRRGIRASMLFASGFARTKLLYVVMSELLTEWTAGLGGRQPRVGDVSPSGIGLLAARDEDPNPFLFVTWDRIQRAGCPVTVVRPSRPTGLAPSTIVTFRTARGAAINVPMTEKVTALGMDGKCTLEPFLVHSFPDDMMAMQVRDGEWAGVRGQEAQRIAAPDATHDWANRNRRGGYKPGRRP